MTPNSRISCPITSPHPSLNKPKRSSGQPRNTQIHRHTNINSNQTQTFKVIPKQPESNKPPTYSYSPTPSPLKGTQQVSTHNPGKHSHDSAIAPGTNADIHRSLQPHQIALLEQRGHAANKNNEHDRHAADEPRDGGKGEDGKEDGADHCQREGHELWWLTTAAAHVATSVGFMFNLFWFLCRVFRPGYGGPRWTRLMLLLRTASLTITTTTTTTTSQIKLRITRHRRGERIIFLRRCRGIIIIVVVVVIVGFFFFLVDAYQIVGDVEEVGLGFDDGTVRREEVAVLVDVGLGGRREELRFAVGGEDVICVWMWV